MKAGDVFYKRDEDGYVITGAVEKYREGDKYFDCTYAHFTPDGKMIGVSLVGTREVDEVVFPEAQTAVETCA